MFSTSHYNANSTFHDFCGFFPAISFQGATGTSTSRTQATYSPSPYPTQPAEGNSSGPTRVQPTTDAPSTRPYVTGKVLILPEQNRPLRKVVTMLSQWIFTVCALRVHCLLYSGLSPPAVSSNRKFLSCLIDTERERRTQKRD